MATQSKEDRKFIEKLAFKSFNYWKHLLFSALFTIIIISSICIPFCKELIHYEQRKITTIKSPQNQEELTLYRKKIQKKADKIFKEIASEQGENLDKNSVTSKQLNKIQMEINNLIENNYIYTNEIENKITTTEKGKIAIINFPLYSILLITLFFGITGLYISLKRFYISYNEDYKNINKRIDLQFQKYLSEKRPTIRSKFQRQWINKMRIHQTAEPHNQNKNS